LGSTSLSWAKIPRRFSPGTKLPCHLEAHGPGTSQPYPPVFPGALAPHLPAPGAATPHLFPLEVATHFLHHASSSATPPCAPPLYRAAPSTKHRRPSRAYPLSRPSRCPQLAAAAASVSPARECQTLFHHHFLLFPRLERLAQTGIIPAAAAILRSAVPESAPSRS
jgi:hypothetical protein